MKTDFGRDAVVLPRDLTPEQDIFGQTIRVGSKVRSHDFPFELGNELTGFALEGARVSYLEGVVEAIGEDVLDGCPRYRLNTARFGLVYPPVNGIRIWGGERRTCGVVVAE